MNLGAWGCPNCEGDEGPAVEVLAGVPAFGGENQARSLFQAGALTAHGLRNDFASETFCVAPTLAGGARKSGGYSCDDIPLTAATLDASYGRLQGCSGQDLNHGHSHLIAFVADDYKDGTFEQTEIARPLTTSADRSRASPIASNGSGVRRLTPRECERLQGFPDDYTLIPWRGKPAEECPDGPRYKAIGNSKAIPVVRWIGRRIAAQLDRLDYSK